MLRAPAGGPALRSISPQSAIGAARYDNSRGAGANTTQLNRVPFLIGSSSVSQIRLCFQGWYVDPGNQVLGVGNSYTINSASVEGNGTSTPIFFAGSRSRVVNSLDAAVLSDAVLASSLGLGNFTVGTTCYLRISVTTTNGAFLPQRGAMIEGNINTVNFDPTKVSVTNGIDSTGDFAYDMISGGVNGTDANYTDTNLPFVVLAEHTGKSIALIGDSKVNGTGDTQPPAPVYVIGAARTLFPSMASSAGCIAGIQMGVPSGFASEHTTGANASIIQNYYNYCTSAVVGYGTNSQNSTAQSALHAALRAKGITQIIQLSLTPRTTGTYTSAAGQTVSAGWGAGQSADTFEIFLRGLIASDANMTYFNPQAIRDTVSGANYWKWKSTGATARTDDGLHENALGYEEAYGTAGQAITQAGGTVSAVLRTLVQALP